MDELIDHLRLADHVAVLTGAGASAESGVPTFRDALTGWWARFDPAQLATPEAFHEHPRMVARWYDQRRLECLGCQPNAGHTALARLQHAMQQRGRRLTVITQNVDRLHQRAGSTGVLELHGSLYRWRCTGCGVEAEETGDRPMNPYPPRCAGCGGARRPGIVWFGEMLPGDAIAAAAEAAQSCDLFMSIGTSAQVYPAAGLIDEALGCGAKLAELNPEPTAYTARADWSLRQGAAEALPGLVVAALA